MRKEYNDFLGKNAYLLTAYGIVQEVGSDFPLLTGFDEEEILGKPYEEISSMLRLSFIENEAVEAGTKVCFLFTKEHEVKKVHISTSDFGVPGLLIYKFKDRSEGMLMQGSPLFNRLYLDNILGVALFSAPDITLLKANRTYLHFFDAPYNKPDTTFGKRIYDFIPGWRGSTSEGLWKQILSTGESLTVDEYEYSHFERGTTYWNASLIPIYENHVLKYVIEITTEITDKINCSKQVQEQKRIATEQKDQLEAILNNTGDTIAIVDCDGNYIRENILSDGLHLGTKTMHEFFSSAEFFDLSGKPMSFEEFPAYKVSKGQKFKNQKLVIRRNNKDEYYDVNGTPIFDEEGNFIMGVLNTHNVTELVAQTKIVKHQKLQLEAIIESMSDALFTFDKSGKATILNKGAEKLFSTEAPTSNAEDIAPFIQFYDLEDKILPIEQMPAYRVLEGEKIRDFRVKAVRGEETFYLDFSGSPIYDEEGEVALAVICGRNMTESTKTEQAIKRQRDGLYKTFEAMNFPITRMSYPELNILELNKNAYEFIKDYLDHPAPSFEDIIGTSMKNYLSKIYLSGDFSMDFDEMRHTKSQIVKRQKRVLLNGEEKYINVLLTPILDINGDIEELVLIGSDVTHEVIEKKEVERIMKLQEEFFSFIAHEFRTPLTTMNSALQLLELVYEREMTENIKRYLKTIKRSTFQQLRLVNNLLDITRAEAGYLKVNKKSYEISSMTKAIVDSIKPFAASKWINLNFYSSFEEQYVAIDEEKYERIILNLLSNAIKFTAEGKNIDVSLSSKKDKLIIEIKDQGVGIPKEKQAVIFERFGQSDTKRSKDGEGTGIGLYLVKLLVTGMDGEIHLRSNETQGTVFTISFPLNAAESTEETPLPELTNNRLVESLQMEFSGIYLS